MNVNMLTAGNYYVQLEAWSTIQFMSYYNHTRILNVNSPYAHCQLPSALGSLSIDPVGCDHSYTQELVIAAAYWKSHWPVVFFMARNSQISTLKKGSYLYTGKKGGKSWKFTGKHLVLDVMGQIALHWWSWFANLNPKPF